MGNVIVIDDNVVYCDYVGNLLAKERITTEKIYSFTAGKKAVLSLSDDDIILSDLRFPDGDGIELLELMRESGHCNPFFIMTDYDEVPTAVRSMKSGADDYISKRKLESDLLPVLRSLWKRKTSSGTKKENIYERESEVFRKIYHRIRLVAPTDISVLILGENGTGKEHIAERIHRLSDRSGKPFVAVDCGLLVPSLAASTLFGHEKGAFTGATESKRGYFGEADGGTLFLDEVGNLPPPCE
ncbi:sigma-54-dependent transcriptional regulator [Rikenella microfusus]|uniref:sigma-54-dependent transcriptional regulator n=1 Tax=Rikenella microfusus TaxID=28139 RepID=UPI000A002969|nr:sigma 54-interacting transcriptional regulator [Rikenella microfusus]